MLIEWRRVTTARSETPQERQRQPFFNEGIWRATEELTASVKLHPQAYVELYALVGGPVQTHANSPG